MSKPFFSFSDRALEHVLEHASGVALAKITAKAGIPVEAVYGTNSGETLFGTDGNDTIFGLGGDDIIFGSYGDDHLYGGSGNDSLVAQYGVDVVSGGSGVDRFSGSIWDWNGDRITDYEYGEKIIIYAGPATVAGYSLRPEGGDTYLDMDGDGNGFADSSIILTGSVQGSFTISTDGVEPGYQVLTIEQVFFI